MLPALITNNHVLDENILSQENSTIEINIKEDIHPKRINLNNRIKYTNKEYDITIIELKDQDEINNYLELDDIVIKGITHFENRNIDFVDKTVYIIQYPEAD